MRSISRVLFLACALAVAQLSAFAAGSVSQSITQLGTTDVYVVTFYWIGDAGTGSVPATVAQGMQGLSGYQFIGAEFSPGTPAPTAGYTVKINSGVGVDLLGGNGAGLSATAPSSAAPSNSATPIIGAVSLVISGNSAAGAQGRVLAYFQKPGLSSPVRISGGSGSGSVSSVTIAGTGFEITVAGTCTITTTGTCTLSVPADFRLPGTVNKITVTQPATGATLTIQDGFTLTVNGNATVSGTNTGDQTLFNQTIQDEGTPLTQRASLNFVGAGITCVDASTKTTCTVNSGGTVVVVGSGNLTNTACVTGGGSQSIQTPSANCTIDASGNAVVNSIATGTSPPALTPGSGGAIACAEGTVPSVGPASGVDVLYCDSTAHTMLLSRNNGSYFPIAQVIFEGTLALGTSAIGSAACAAAATVTATGLVTTDVVTASFNGDPTAVTGYIPLTAGGLWMVVYPTANTINVKVCNSSSSSITPGAITLNVMAVRK